MKNFLNRMTAYALSALLCLGAAPPIHAEAEASRQSAKNANLYIFTSDYNTAEAEETKYAAAATAVGDDLYILTQQTLEKWTPGLTEPIIVLDKLPTREPYQAVREESIYFSRLLSDGKRVFGLEINTGELWILADGTEGFTPALFCTLEWDQMLQQDGQYTYFNGSIMDIDLVDGTLYMVVMSYEGQQSVSVRRWEFETGKALPSIEKTLIQSLTPYQEGRFLCVLFDSANSWDEALQKLKPTRLGTLDLQTGEVTPLFDLAADNVYGLSYIAETNTAYYYSQSTVYSLPHLAQPAKVSAYMPTQSWSEASFGILSGSMYFCADYNGAIVRELDTPDVEKGALVVTNPYDNRSHNRFIVNHPEIMVSITEQYFSTLEGIAGAMISGEGGVDVYNINSNYAPLARLLDKGYALELGTNAEIAQVTDAMYPAITDACKKDGKLYALPVSMDAWTMGYSKEVWEELGLNTEDLPKTFYELMDFAENWEDDYADDHADIRLFEDPSWKDSLMQSLNEQYIAYVKQQKLPMDFTTELYRKLLLKLDGLPEPDAALIEQEDREDFWSQKSVFASYVSVAYFYSGYDRQPLILPLDTGLAPVIPVNLNVLVVNPRSTRTNEALLYLEEMSRAYDEQSTNISFFPDHNDPVPNRRYEQDVKYWQEALEQVQKDLETAQPEEVASLKERMQNLEDILKDENYRIYVSEEDIQNYRENVAPYLYVVGQTPLNIWDQDGKNEFSTLLQQYRDGAISAEQYAQEMSKRLRMIDLEDQ